MAMCFAMCFCATGTDLKRKRSTVGVYGSIKIEVNMDLLCFRHACYPKTRTGPLKSRRKTGGFSPKDCHQHFPEMGD